MGIRRFKYKPVQKINRWKVKFPNGILPDNKIYKYFKTEEEARSFVLELIPDAYDEKHETERCCVDCRCILPIEEFKSRRFCKTCKASRFLKSKYNRINVGLCKFVNCNEQRLKNNQMCYNHWFDKKAGDHLKDATLGINLINIYERQNRKCVYTGVDLIPNDNMSLDHIISRYDRPDLINDVNNLQWVHKDINSMKNRFSHDSFIMLCKYIANRFT